MGLKLPKWVRVVIYVPEDEKARTVSRLREMETRGIGVNVNWSVHGTYAPWTSAKKNERRVEKESEGDVVAMTFTGLGDDRTQAAWAVMASAGVSRLARLQEKYPQCDLRSMVRGILLGYMMRVLDEKPYPEVIVIAN